MPADATAVFQPLSEEPVAARQERALDYLRTFYGVRVVGTADVLGETGDSLASRARQQPFPNGRDRHRACPSPTAAAPGTGGPASGRYRPFWSPVVPRVRLIKVGRRLTGKLRGQRSWVPTSSATARTLAVRACSSSCTPAPGASRRSPAMAWSRKR